MAIRQYIGARYVPIFLGEYNPASGYEPLSIVTYLNNSYTSKKTVPQGVLPSNTEYWALTGNYNAQIAEFIDDLNDIGDRVTQAEEDVAQVEDDLTQAVTQIEGNLTQFDGRITQVEGDITQLDNRVTQLETVTSRKYFFFCDSYGFGFSSETGTTNRGWMYWVANILGLTPNSDYFALTPGIDIGGGAYGIASTVAGEHSSFADLFIAFNKTGIPLDEITDVVIFSGYNDINYASTIHAGMVALDNVIKQYMPNVQRIVCGLYAYSQNEAAKRGLRSVYYEYSRCIELNWIFASNSAYSCVDSTIADSDNVHLTQEGYRISAPYLAACVLNGNCDVEKFAAISLGETLSPNNAVIQGVNGVYPLLLIHAKNEKINFAFNCQQDNWKTNFNVELTNCYADGGYNLYNMPNFVGLSGTNRAVLCILKPLTGNALYAIISCNRDYINVRVKSENSNLVNATLLGFAESVELDYWDL